MPGSPYVTTCCLLPDLMYCPCGGSLEWDDQVGSDLCIVCGILVDSTQTAFSSAVHFEQVQDTYQDSTLRPNHSSIVDRRGRTQHQTASDSKDARTFKHKLAMRETIKSLTNSLSAHGAYDRAVFIFEAAMDKGAFRWGRKATIVAAASVSIALRESKQSGSIRELSAAIQTHCNHTFRAFASITKLLNLNVTASANPESVFPLIMNHVSESAETDEFSKPLVQFLKSVNMQSVLQTATSLSTLMASTIAELSIAVSACALFVVALEAEARQPTPCLREFTPFLGRVIGLKSGVGVITARMKFFRDEIDKWKVDLPWLETNAAYANTKAPKGKRKKVIATRGIKDLIQIEIDKWDASIVKVPISSSSSSSDDEGEGEGEDDPANDPATTASPLENNGIGTIADKPQRKRKGLSDIHRIDKRKKLNLPEQTYRFLLDPTASSPHPTSRLSSQFNDTLNSNSTTASSQVVHQKNTCLELANYILSVPSYSLVQGALPSRLALLTAERRGSDRVEDDELFEPGEFESLFRNEQERNEVRRILGWEEGVGEIGWQQTLPPEVVEAHAPPTKKASRKARAAANRNKGARRINMDAFNSFFSNDSPNEQTESDNAPLAYASLAVLEGGAGSSLYTFDDDADQADVIGAPSPNAFLVGYEEDDEDDQDGEDDHDDFHHDDHYLHEYA